MDISIVNALPDVVVKALCNTLIHSLWQGLVLSAVAGLIVVFTRKTTSAMRYNLLVASLCLFAVGTVYTFVSQLHSAEVTGASKVQVLDIHVVNDFHNYVDTANIQTSVADRLINYFNTHAQMIVLVWFLIVCARSIQLLTGLQGVYRLRRLSVFAVDAQWQDRVNQLSAKLGIKRAVAIVESGLAKVPMVIGHLKPMILIPVGLITALPPAEVDAILVHELAHIRRRDYLVNLLQSFMEIVFFFNPAVLWISTLIKTERENCCDDIAIAQTTSKANYIKALVSCQEYRLAAPAYAMALSGEKNGLLGRVKRMVSNNNQSLNLTEKSLLAICLLTAGLVTTAFSNADNISKLIKTTTKAVAQVSHVIKKEIVPEKETIQQPDTLSQQHAVKPIYTIQPDTTVGKIRIYKLEEVGDKTSVQTSNNGFTTYLRKTDGNLYQLNFKDGVLQSTQVNGKTLSNDEYYASKPKIDQIIADQDVQMAQQTQKLDINLSSLRVKPVVNLNTINLKIDQAIESEIDSARQANKVKVQPLPPLQPTLKIQPKPALKAPPALKVQPASPAQPAISAISVDAYRARQADYTASAAKYKPYKTSKDDSLRNGIIADMIKDGLIKNKDSKLSFKLSTSEFIVNGEKQPDGVYQKYRAEYVKVTGHNEWSWYYNYDTATENKTERKSITTY